VPFLVLLSCEFVLIFEWNVADDRCSVLFIVTLAFTAVYLHRHRTAGGHCVPYPNNVADNVEMKRGSTGAIQNEQTAPVQENPSGWV
jgi:hypothetical protein